MIKIKIKVDSEDARLFDNLMREITSMVAEADSSIDGKFTVDAPPRLRKPPTKEWANLILESRAEAELVLDQMRGLIEVYGYATVADLLGYCGVATNFGDVKWGWKTLVAAQIRRTEEPKPGGGYLIWLTTPDLVP